MRDLEPISQRAQQLLKNLVTHYLKDGQPVSSKILANEMVPSLSSATVRKVLQDLETLGYLISPHTSAGRIPTTLGLRFFVNHLRQFELLDVDQYIAKRMESKIDTYQSADSMASQVSAVLSELTQMVGIVSLPRYEKNILKHVEFLPLNDNRVLAILVLNNQDVQNRVIVTSRVYSAAELTQASNFLNQHFIGTDLSLARTKLFAELKQDRQSVDSLMQSVIDVAGKAFVPAQARADYVLAGQEHLLQNQINEPVPLDQLHKMFEAFTKKQQILHLLDQCLNSEGIQLFIGNEWADGAFESYSLITSKYQYNGGNVGVLGVIGPARMPYQKVIPVVDLTAKLLSSALNSE